MGDSNPNSFLATINAAPGDSTIGTNRKRFMYLRWSEKPYTGRLKSVLESIDILMSSSVFFCEGLLFPSKV